MILWDLTLASKRRKNMRDEIKDREYMEEKYKSNLESHNKHF